MTREAVDCMGTVFSLDVRTPGVDASPAIAWLHEADARFSTYRRNSEINRLARGELPLDRCHPDVCEVLAIGAAAEREGAGGFSLTAAGRLDPSGVVKGWAIQRASRMLAEAGSTSHLLNGGGDIATLGSRPDGGHWRIAVASPARHDRVVAVVSGPGIAVATSGSAERGGHVIDPRTGGPAQDLLSLTVAGTCSVTAADIRATTAFALGLAGLRWLERYQDCAGLAITAQGAALATSRWHEYRAAQPVG